jgi:cell division protein FtsL
LRTAYTITRPVANTYLVRERDRRRLRELALVLLAVLLLAGGLLGYVWVQHEVLQSGYRVTELERRLERLERQRRQLEVEAEYLSGPAQIVGRAERELGLQGRSQEQMVFPEELR